MPANDFPKLAAASIGGHVADQMMLALLPLVLVAAGASARTVSIVVAAHAAAWLVVSLPVGAYADVMSRRTIMQLGATTMMAGATIGACALQLGFQQAWVLAITAFVIASGVVILILSVFALIPRVLDASALAPANALLEFGRAVVCIAAPIVAARLVARETSVAGFAIAFVGGAVAFLVTRALPREPTATVETVSMRAAIREGAAFVIEQPLLRAIAVCAIAWNSAFFALTAVFAPFAAGELGLSIEGIGNAWSIYGIGLLLGSVAAAPMIARLPTGFMFVFGPVLSCLAVLALAALADRDTTWPVGFCFFCLGFGPMTWLVLQTSVRQIVTPHALLGRVGATITTTIYGVRPLGALLAGAMAAAFGARSALWLSTVLFVFSCVAMLLSPAARLKAMPRPA